MIIIVQDAAAQDRTTAISLALVSKSVGRMAESVLYTRIVLRSLASARAFTSTLRTKNRELLALVTELTLMSPAPRDFEDFWALIDQCCPHIERLSIFAQDLDVVRPTRAQPHNLSHSFANPPNHIRPTASDRGGDANEVSHLYLPNQPQATPPAPVLKPGTGFLHLTHFSCFVDMGSPQRLLPRWYHPLWAFLDVPTLRMCVVALYQPEGLRYQYRFPHELLACDDRRLVPLPRGIDDPHILSVIKSKNGGGEFWECAEETIAARSRSES
ncbi:hypothetical protein K438DRAFT_513558 [Mycena galopus ATCC 62051]|nr:hypothetical protein K438DRAFT_513558 [Mycena galopus ATCC 62051]